MAPPVLGQVEVSTSVQDVGADVVFDYLVLRGQSGGGAALFTNTTKNATCCLADLSCPAPSLSAYAAHG